jgi:4-alpha-glucanotransferase
MQDYLELTNYEGRMNTPAVADGNWNWRLNPRYRTKALADKIKEITKRTKRAVK